VNASPRLALALAGCTLAASACPEPSRRTLTVAGFSAIREATAELLPAFAAQWQAETGETLRFAESYQSSGAQSRAIRDGLEADVALLALPPDVQALADAGLVAPDWQRDGGGLAAHSLVALAVRPGNPHGVRSFADLADNDIEIVMPNARTSGGAIWTVLALWGAASQREDALFPVLSRVRVMDKGARESFLTFESGVGDVAITYEHEVLLAQASGKPVEIVLPAETLRVDYPAAVVATYARDHGLLDAAEALVAFIRGPDGQAILRRHGFRGPGDVPESVMTIDDLGGWRAARDAVLAPGAAYDTALARAR
jgi:sulfate transport system substrate-binding protein